MIEFVSPSNKRNPGLIEFRAKRAEFLTAGVNFVEVDSSVLGIGRRCCGLPPSGKMGDAISGDGSNAK